ncbi:chaplin [Streptomyces sp. NPDC000880]
MNSVKKAALVLATAGLAAGSAAGSAFADAGASGVAQNSPGALSGNLAEVPLHLPVNLSGNSVNVIGALNPAFGNIAENS